MPPAAEAGLAALLAFQGDSESELVRVIDNIDLVTPYYLLMHRDMQQTPRVRAFADFVAAGSLISALFPRSTSNLLSTGEVG